MLRNDCLLIWFHWRWISPRDQFGVATSQSSLTCIRFPDHSKQAHSRKFLTSYIYCFAPSSLHLFCSNIQPQQSRKIFVSFIHPSIHTTSAIHLCSFALLVHRYSIPKISHPSTKILHHTRTIHTKPHQANQEQSAIMSDAPDTTFSNGESKLLISIIKNLTGNLEVCLFFFLCTSLFPALWFYNAMFGFVPKANATVMLRLFFTLVSSIFILDAYGCRSHPFSPYPPFWLYTFIASLSHFPNIIPLLILSILSPCSLLPKHR